MGTLAAAFRALRHRNFRLFATGQVISLVGTWMQQVAQAWLVYRLTRSASLLGLVGFAGQIPVLLVGPIGGSFADRHHRHRIVVTTQTLSMLLAFALAAVTLAGVVQVWHVFALAVLLGIVNAFDIPARQVFIFDMVGREDLMNAIALNSSLVNGARMLGPAIAGLLVSAVGEGWCFFVNGVSFVAVIACLLLMRIARPAARERGSPLGEIVEGFRYVGRTKPIRALLLLLGLVSFMGMPYSVLMPIFADRVLHGGARELGILMAASGLGALGGALALAARTTIRGLGRWIAFATAGFGTTLVLFSLSDSLWLSSALLVPAGFAFMVQMAATNTLLQTLAPDELRGRVMAVYSMMFMGMYPCGSLVAGALADRFGAPVTVAAGGLFCLAGAGFFALRLPSLRAAAREMPTMQAILAPAAGESGGRSDA